MSSLRSGGNGIEKIEEAMDFINNRLSADELGVPPMPSTPGDSIHGTLTSQVPDQPNTCISNPLVNNDALDSKLNSFSGENAAPIPSELIANCVATFLMIQVILVANFQILVVLLNSCFLLNKILFRRYDITDSYCLNKK